MATKPTSHAAPQHRGLRFLSAFASAFAFVILLTMLFIAMAAIVVPQIAGAQTYRVLTQSMSPGMPPGTFLVVKPTPPTELRVGDIVTYQLRSGEPEVVTHRITEVTQSTSGELRFITQGDNNAVPDEKEVRPEQIRGKVWYGIPYLGWVTNFRDQSGELWIPIIAGALFLYAVGQFSWWGYQKLRSRRHTQAKLQGKTRAAMPAKEDDYS